MVPHFRRRNSDPSAAVPRRKHLFFGDIVEVPVVALLRRGSGSCVPPRRQRGSEVERVNDSGAAVVATAAVHKEVRQKDHRCHQARRLTSHRRCFLLLLWMLLFAGGGKEARERANATP